ncbi:ABC transporter permease [[Empedobacter] haloabium]|uniref:ABC transporter permease n=1 Tax=[Empedobacter] haloabium TaxID=592317 RepID=A0ABZ1UWM3_9BURK
MSNRVTLILALGLALAGAATCRAGTDCPPLAPNTITGGDYTNPEDRQKLEVVERFHFTPNVERLERGQSGSIGADMSYTLDHFANHHRALAALARLAVREKNPRPQGAKLAVDCYFGRAIAYRPADARVRAIFGGYLLALGQEAAALAQLEEAARLEPGNATNQYNLGLLYVRQKEYAKAREAARLAYQLGFPLPGLKNKLAAAGQWQER